ncbi:MAG: hypothetical protein Q8P92_02340 [Candidatus Daviesbacteria bacterium]|nr:hypothetical protein [Candidatus Daviesbacteria bacterium]
MEIENKSSFDKFITNYSYIEGNFPQIPLFLEGLTTQVLLYRDQIFGTPTENFLPGYVLGASVFIIGRLADRISTVHGSRTAIRANEAGIKHNTYEGNRLYSLYPTERGVFSKKWAAIDSVLLSLGLLYPPLAAALGTMFTFDAINNVQAQKYLERKIKRISLSN